MADDLALANAPLEGTPLIPAGADLPVETPRGTMKVPAWAQAMAEGAAPPGGGPDVAVPPAMKPSAPMPSPGDIAALPTGMEPAAPVAPDVKVRLPDGTTINLGANPSPELREQVKAKIRERFPELQPGAVTTTTTTPTSTPSPTFMGEMAKEGERQIEAAKSVGEDIAAPFTQPSTGSFSSDFLEGVKHGMHAAWTALGAVSHPGAVPEAALTAAGHPTAGKVAGVAQDVATSLLLTGRPGTAITSAEEAAIAAKGAIGTAAKEAVAGAKAGYTARDVAADAANLILPADSPAILALKKTADEMVKKHGSKAAEWVGRIEALGENGAVSHEEIRNIEAGLTEMAKRDPWIGHLRDGVKVTRDAMEAQAPDVAAQSAQLAQDYPAVAKLRRLKKQVVNPSNAPSTERTTAEALRALNDPDRLKQALATMDAPTAKAFQAFHQQAKIAQVLSGGSGIARDIYRSAFVPLMAIEGGRLIYNSTQGKLNLGELGAAGAALALHSPTVAMMAARALTTPSSTPAAAILARSLDTELGLSEEKAP